MRFLEQFVSDLKTELSQGKKVLFEHLAHLRPCHTHARQYLKKDPLIALVLVFTLAGPALAFFPFSNGGVNSSIGSRLGTNQAKTKDIASSAAAKTVKKPVPRPVSTVEAPAAASAPVNSQPAPYQPVPAPPPAPPKIVSGWLPNWDMGTGLQSMIANPAVLNELSPFWYYLTPEGGITASPGTGNAHVINTAKSQGQIVVPTISNSFKGDRVEAVIHDLGRRDKLIDDIVNLVVQSGYDGIDIDFEAVSGEYRNDFTGFVQVLGYRLDQHGKILSVTVMPKASEPGSPYGASSQDYAAIAAASDRVRIMAYDNHYQGGDPGPVAPANWVDQLLAYAVTVIPREKLILGVPSYGYDWAPTGGKSNGRGITFEKAMSLANQHQSAVTIDGPSHSPTFQYEAGGVLHHVWFENAESLKAKLDIANKWGIGGIAIWRLGREDPGTWQIIREKMDR